MRIDRWRGLPPLRSGTRIITIPPDEHLRVSRQMIRQRAALRRSSIALSDHNRTVSFNTSDVFIQNLKAQLIIVHAFGAALELRPLRFLYDLHQP